MAHADVPSMMQRDPEGNLFPKTLRDLKVIRSYQTFISAFHLEDLLQQDLKFNRNQILDLGDSGIASLDHEEMD